MGITITKELRIRVNGKDYDRVEDLPPEIREVYEKSIGVGLGSTTVTFNGKTYKSANEMPPELRRQFETLMAMAKESPGVGEPRRGLSLSFKLGQPAEDDDEPVSSTRLFVIAALFAALLALIWVMR